eukprot:764497-Hanusia_phi.AAC.2
MAGLEGVRGKEAMGRRVALGGGKVRIGRGGECEISLPWDGMSRTHAVIEGIGEPSFFVNSEGGKIFTNFRIRDCGSSNGVFVNQVKVSECLLRDGDEIGFGRGASLQEGEAIHPRHVEYAFVFRKLKLHGASAASREAPSEESKGGRMCPPCKSFLYPPTPWANKKDLREFSRPPPAMVELDWVHGYRSARQIMEPKSEAKKAGRCLHLNNAKFVSESVIAYPASRFVVLFDFVERQQRYFAEHDNDCVCLAVGASRSVVASGQLASFEQRSPPIYVWDVASCSVLARLQGFHRQAVTALAFSPTEQFLASIGGDDMHSLAVYDWEKKQLLFSGNGYVEEVFGIAFSPFNLDEIIQVGSKHIKFWSLEAEKSVMATFRQEKNAKDGQRRTEPQLVACCAYTAEGMAICGLEEGHISMYSRTKTGRNECVDRIDNAHAGPVLALCGMQNGIISSGRDGYVKVWAPPSTSTGRKESGKSREGTRRSTRESLTAKLRVDVKDVFLGDRHSTTVVTSLDYIKGKILCGSSCGNIFFIGLKDGAIEQVVSAHFASVTAVDVCPYGDSYYLTVSEDRTLRRWDIGSRKMVMSVWVGLKSTSVAIHPDETLYALGHRNGHFTVWDVPPLPQPPRCLLKSSQRTEDVTQVRFSPDGRCLAVASREQLIDLYSVESDFRLLGTCRGHSAAVLHVDFSSDSRWLRSSCAAGELLFWEIPSCRPHGRASLLRDVPWDTHSVVFDWSLSSIWPPAALVTSIDSVDVSHDLQLCVSGNDRGELSLFPFPAVGDLEETHRNCKRLLLHSSHIRGVAFSNEDNWLVSVSSDGSAAQWRVRREEGSENKRAVVSGWHEDGGFKQREITRPPRVGTYANPHSRHIGGI